jgi:hypothetical protein
VSWAYANQFAAPPLGQSPETWLFPSSRKQIPTRPANFLRRVLKPAAIRAKIALRPDKKGGMTTALNFQSLRRTSATEYGARAKARSPLRRTYAT